MTHDSRCESEIVDKTFRIHLIHLRDHIGDYTVTNQVLNVNSHLAKANIKEKFTSQSLLQCYTFSVPESTGFHVHSAEIDLRDMQI